MDTRDPSEDPRDQGTADDHGLGSSRSQERCPEFLQLPPVSADDAKLLSTCFLFHFLIVIRKGIKMTILSSDITEVLLAEMTEFGLDNTFIDIFTHVYHKVRSYAC